jgi:hypothetical protein
MYYPSSQPARITPIPRATAPSKAPNVSAFLGNIKKEDLLSAIGKLKSACPTEIPKGERNKITADDLQKQRDSIKQHVTRTIMFDSIKHMPVEGDPG